MRLFRINIILAVMVVCSCLTTTAFAQRNELKLSDDAPGLDIETWLNDEISIENQYTYIVLFFSTTDARIDRVFSLLSKLQDNLHDERFHVLGITDEDEDVIKPFLRRNADGASFPVALDRRGATNRNWVGASSIEDNPAAFIVDKRGKVQYMGDPLDDEMQEILKLVLFDRYDARLYKEARPTIKAIKTARTMRNWRMCLKYLDDLIATDEYAFAPKVLEKFEILLVDMDERDRAYEYANEVMTQYASDGPVLMRLAHKIVEDPKIPDEKRDLDVALLLVKSAVPTIDPSDPDRYSSEALVHFHRGEFREAVRLQQKAYFTSPPERKDVFKDVMKKYMEAARQEAKTGH